MTTGEDDMTTDEALLGPDEHGQQSEAPPATDATPNATRAARDSATKAATRTKATTGKAAKAAKDSAARAAANVRAARAAREGRLKEARAIAAEADLDEGAATKAIAELEALHYLVEVNKRGLSVNALTTTLNERWENGWRLAHMLEQRGNTVLVFEKRSQEI